MADPLSVGITLALTAGQMALQMTRKIEGPRLQDLKVSVADYGTILNYFYGIRRFQGNPIIFAEDIIEIKKKKKTKGGKYNDYTYYCTWAVVVADHQIDAVTRIWFDKHLIYDATGASPVTPFDFGDFNSVARRRLTNSSSRPLDHIRIYLGAEDQEADPRMLAWAEARYGAGSCPAYRGVSYILFEDIPLEKVGNRIPQISVEAVSNGAPAYPYRQVETGIGIPSGNLSISPDFSRFIVTGGTGDYEIWDTLSRSVMIGGTLTDAGSRGAIGNDGTIYYIRSGSFFADDTLMATGPDGLGAVEIGDLPSKASRIAVVSGPDGQEIVVCLPYSALTTVHVYIVGSVIPISSIDLGWVASHAFADAYNKVWCVGSDYSATSSAYAQVVFGGADGFTVPAAKGVGIPAVGGAHNDASGQYIIDASGDLYFVDDQTFALNTTAATLGGIFWPSVSYYDLTGFAPNGGTSYEFSLEDGSAIRSFTMFNWVAESSSAIFYDPINHAFVSWHNGAVDLFTWRFLDRVGSDGVVLADIIADVAIRCGIDPDDFDASDCDQTITGYSWTQGAGKSILEPLCDAYDSFCRPHDFSLEFLKRGAASGGTIDVAQFVRQSDKRYVVTRTLDTDLPARIWLNFADIDADQQPNDVPSQRTAGATGSKRELSIDLTTLALDINDARQLADRVFRRKWFGRVGVQNALSAQYLAIEPGDVRVLTLDGQGFRGRARRWTYGADGVIALDWERDDVAVATLNGAEGAPMDGREESVIAVPLPSKGFVLDIPLIRDADNDVNPLLYYGAGPYSSAGAWPGAVIYQSLDGGEEYTDEVGSVPSTSGLTWGLANGALADANPWMWDRGNSVSVTVKYGSLTSTTEAEIDANESLNLCLLGDELMQFTTATLASEDANGKVYTLTGFKRGRRGSDWATSTHVSGEQFVMLDNVDNFEMGASDLGEDLLFKAVTTGRDARSSFPVPVNDYAGESNKPYSPVQLEAVKDPGTGDWVIDWVRRSRIGGRWVGGTTMPLGESAENYEVDILDAPGGAVVRTITATSPTATYTAAQQVTDGGAVAIGDLDIQVRQVGDLMDGRNRAGSF